MSTACREADLSTVQAGLRDSKKQMSDSARIGLRKAVLGVEIGALMAAMAVVLVMMVVALGWLAEQRAGQDRPMWPDPLLSIQQSGQ